METYLVGGAVRDALLGLPVKERDYVVVGARASDLRARGFRQVGRDFPVFLHPRTGDEYALARTERKAGSGHRGFVVHADPSVTLEEDLRRRDLTINAMAESRTGELIDPYGGRADLEARLLRHTSAAFVEDPLRVFRVARFAARLDGFTVAPETLSLMRRMTAEGALAELSAERVWRELEASLVAVAPQQFFLVLQDVRGMQPWLAELEGRSISIPLTLDRAEQRFAALVCGLAVAECDALAERLQTPKRFQRMARWSARYAALVARWREAAASAITW